MANSNPFVLLYLPTPPFGAAVLEVAGDEDGAVALVRLRTLEDATDFVADRLDVVTVVFAPTTGVGTAEAGTTGDPEFRPPTIGVGTADPGSTGDPELRPPIGYGGSPPVGIGWTSVSGLGEAEPAGIGVVWISSEVTSTAGTNDVGALQSGVAVTVTVTVDSAGTIQSGILSMPNVSRS